MNHGWLLTAIALGMTLPIAGCGGGGGDGDAGRDAAADSSTDMDGAMVDDGDVDAFVPGDAGSEDAGAGDGGHDAGRCPDDDGGATTTHCDATDLIIAGADPGNTITLFNPTASPIAVADSNYQLCQRPIYAALEDLDAGATIAAGGSHTFPWPEAFPDTDAGGELAIYSSPVFGSPAALLDFVCWGTGHAALSRKSVAESDGDWCGGCAAAITGDALVRIPGTDGTTARSYDPTGGAAELTCP